MNLQRIWASRFLPITRGILLAGAIGCAAPALHPQVPPPDEAQPGVMSALDEAATYPVQSQTMQTPNLNRLNENADTSRYADSALTRGPFFFSIDASGAWTTNLTNSLDDQPSTSGTYYDIGVPVGLHLWSETTDFSAYFKGDAAFYPGNSPYNHTSAVYSQQLTHQSSQTTTTSWSLAGGHIVTLGHYLSPLVGVGTTGVLAPQQAGGLQSLNDAATTFSISRQTSERDSFIAAGTAGWFDQPAVGQTSTGPSAYRQLTGGGVIQWLRALNSREMAGVELSEVYIAGISPSGMGNFASAKITFAQTLTPHSSVSAGIGPLFAQSDLGKTQSQSQLTYAANAQFQYRRAFGHVTAGFSRVYELGYLAPASTANELYFSFYRPLTPKVFVSETLQFVTSHEFAGTNNYAQFASTTRIDMYLTHTLDYHVETSSFLQNTSSVIPGYSDNEISTGVTYYFGNPLSRAGVQ